MQSETDIRLADLLASLSLAIDLGVGKPMEWVLSSCLLGCGLSDALALGESERVELRGPIRLLAPLLGLMFRSAGNTILRNLKRLVEQQQQVH